MSGKVNLKLVSATGSILEQQVDMVVLPGHDGDMGILPQHAALIAQLRPGLVRLYDNNIITQQIFITIGYVHVSDTSCTVLVAQWTPLDQLDRQQLEIERGTLIQELNLTDNALQRQVLQDHLDITDLQLNIINAS